MNDYKTKRQRANKQVNYHSKKTAIDRWTKRQQHVVRTDMGIFDLGYKWFNEGFALEDADEKLRNDFNFISGFNKAKRMKPINDDLESLGAEWFRSGLDLDKAQANYVNNPYFKMGYDNARKNSNGRSL